MGKIKTIVVVIVLAAAGAVGAMFGLAKVFQSQVLAAASERLSGAVENAVDEMRVVAFERITSLMRAAREGNLPALAAKAPATTGMTEEAAATALAAAHTEAVPALEEALKKLKLARLLLLSGEGRVVAQAPDKDKFAESWKNLPAAAECLQGIPRDGLYEISGKLTQVAVAPLTDDKGKVTGCLLAAEEINPEFLGRINRRTGTETAILLRQSVYLSTGDPARLAELASLGTGEDVIWFGQAEHLPLFVQLERRGFAARVTTLPAGTDPVQLAVVLPIAPMLLPLAEAHKTAMFGAGALLILGLLLAVFIPTASDRHIKRLRDDLTLMANGDGSYVVDPASYTGIVREIAASVAQLAPTRAGRPPTARATPPPAFAPEAPASPEPPRVSQSSPPPLDFESLLGSASSPPLPAPAAPAAPAEPAFSALDLLQQPTPAPARPAMAAPTPAAPFSPTAGAASGGPRVDLPNDLANIFDEGDATREVAPVIPPQARPEPPRPSIRPAPAPAAPRISFVPPAPPASNPPVLDLSDEDQITSSDYRPDSTVIAQVPDELLRVSATREAPAPEPSPAFGGISRPPAAGGPVSAEDAHFREVFEQFLKTKKQCNEPLAGLTMDKFVDKLRKNAAELKARYHCNSVRFQVYVKAGKAALKATPVK